LILFDVMQTGHGKTNPTPRDIVDVNDATADTSFADDFIGARQAGLFAVMPPEIEKDGEKLLTATSNIDCMTTEAKFFSGNMLDRPAGRAYQGSGVVFADMSLGVAHGCQS